MRVARFGSCIRVLALSCLCGPLGAATARAQAPKPAVVADPSMVNAFSLEATAADAPTALALARLALDRFDR